MKCYKATFINEVPRCYCDYHKTFVLATGKDPLEALETIFKNSPDLKKLYFESLIFDAIETSKMFGRKKSSKTKTLRRPTK